MKKIRVAIILTALCLCAVAEQKDDLSSAAHKALAKVSGQLRIQGLDRPVNVLRDRWGVAHIYAQNQHDLFFAQGVVAAQDRLFQMELWKRAGQGRLAEILGPSALARDINARALRYRGDMEGEYKSYSPDTKATDRIHRRHQLLYRQPDCSREPGLATRVSTRRIFTRHVAPRRLFEPHGRVFHDRQCIQRTGTCPRSS